MCLSLSIPGSIQNSASWELYKFCILENLHSRWPQDFHLETLSVMHPGILKTCILEACSILQPGNILDFAFWKPPECCILETCSILHSGNKPNFVNWKHSLFCILKVSWVRVSWKNAQYCIHDKFCNLETPICGISESLVNAASWKHAQFCILENCWKLLNTATGNTLYSAFWKPHECSILETCSLLNVATGKHPLFCILKASRVQHPRNMPNSASWKHSLFCIILYSESLMSAAS